jgi:hypothetical protein
MSNNLFYSENREIRGGFLKPMFEICSKIDRTCGFCGKSYFNPQKQENDDQLKKFCGVAGSYDTQVSSLPECWLKMTKSQRSTYTKKKKEELFSIQIRSSK